MACGPIPLTPQVIQLAASLFGAPPALPPGLGPVMDAGHPKMEINVLCQDNKPTGWTIERYFDTSSPVAREVELDDGEVDVQTAYVMNPADGQVAQKVTVRLDGEYKLAPYAVEALCSGNNPNALVCTQHVPTIQALGLGISKGAHADWMQTLVPEVGGGGEYVFVSASEYPDAKKAAGEKRAGANPSAPPPSAPPTQGPATDPHGEGATASPITPLTGGLLALVGVLGVATGVSLVKLRASNKQNRKLKKQLKALDPNDSPKNPEKKSLKRPVQPDAQVAVRAQQADMADQGMPPAPRAPVERRQTRANPPSPAAPAAPVEPAAQPEDIAVALAEFDNEEAAKKQT